MMRDGGCVAPAPSAIPVAPGEEVSEWLQVHGIGGVKLASALAACEDELLETVGDLRRMADDGDDDRQRVAALVELGFKRVIAKTIVESFAFAHPPAAALGSALQTSQRPAPVWTPSTTASEQSGYSWEPARRNSVGGSSDDDDHSEAERLPHSLHGPPPMSGLTVIEISVVGTVLAASRAV